MASPRRHRCGHGVGGAVDGPPRQRPLRGVDRARPPRPPRVRRRRMDRPPRIVAARRGQEDRRRCRRERRVADRRGPARRRPRPGGLARRRPLARRSPTREGTPRTAAPRRPLDARRRPLDRCVRQDLTARADGPTQRTAGRRRRPPAGSHRRLVRVLSPLECRRDTTTNAARLDRPARPRRRDGVRRRLSATDPSDRALAPEGPQRDDIARARRRRQPVGDRLRGRRPHGCQSGPRDHRRRHRLRIGVPRPQHGTGTRHRVPVLSRPPVGDRAPRVVRETGRRQHPVRREPTQEVPGHLSDRLRVRRLAEPVASVGRRHPLLDRARGADVPRRQPSHQGLCVLGVGPRFDPQRVSRHGLPRRGIHPSPGDGAPRQDRVQPVVHVLRVAPSRLGTAGVLRGPVDSDRRCVPPERLAEHAGHPDRATPDRRSADVRDSGDPGGHALAELGRLRAGVRATRARTGARGLRGVPRLREVPDPHVGSRPPRHARPAAHSAQRDSPRAPSVQAARHDPLPRDRRQRPALFQQDGPRRRRRRGVGRRQPRSVRTPQRFRRHRPCRTRAPRRLRLRRGRRARWRHLPLERQPQLRRSCAMVGVGPHLHRPPDHRTGDHDHTITEPQETAP